jgi:hypothetical protein
MMCIGHLSGTAGPHFHCHNMCTMWIINQVLSLNVLSYYRLLCYLAHASLCLVCVFLLDLYPYVSMGIAAHWVNYRQVNNVWTDMYLIIIIVRHICQFLSCVYQLESRVQYGVCPIFCRDIVLIGRSTLWTFDVFKRHAVVGPTWVLDVRDTNANIWCDRFWQFILNGLVPLILHSLSAFIPCGSYDGLWNNCWVIHHVLSV